IFAQGMPMRIGSTEREAHWLLNLVVLPEARRHGIATALHRRARRETAITMAIDVSAPAQRVSQRAGGNDAGVAPLYLRPLTATRALSARFGRLGALTGAASWFPLRALEAFSRWQLRRAGVSLQPIARFDEQADRIW